MPSKKKDTSTETPKEPVKRTYKKKQNKSNVSDNPLENITQDISENSHSTTLEIENNNTKSCLEDSQSISLDENIEEESTTTVVDVETTATPCLEENVSVSISENVEEESTTRVVDVETTTTPCLEENVSVSISENVEEESSTTVVDVETTTTPCLEERIVQELPINVDDDSILGKVVFLEENIEEKSIESELVVSEIREETNILNNDHNNLNEKILNDIENAILASEDNFKSFNDEENTPTEYSIDEKVLLSILNDQKLYDLDYMRGLFNKFKEAIMIVQIINGEIKFIEKNGFETRNQSVIDLLVKTNNYKKLPNVQFIIFTNDFISHPELKKNEYLLTFCKNHLYRTSLFPNFNFNHWLEAGIDEYEKVYEKFTNTIVDWDSKQSKIFWSGSNTNEVRKKVYEESKKYDSYFINLLDKKLDNKHIPIDETLQYKYLLNMSGHSYSGRLNYLFLTSSCIINLRNKNNNHYYEEYYYKYFIPNEDYIEILYDDNDTGENIINIINNRISDEEKCNIMANKCYEKAKKVFHMNSIYEYIYNLCTGISKRNNIKSYLQNSIFYTPQIDYYFKDRLQIYNENSLRFEFKGNDLDINMFDIDNNKINLKIINDQSSVTFNDTLILHKYTPFIIQNHKNHKYDIQLNDNELNFIIEKKFTLFKCKLPVVIFNIIRTEIKTLNGGWWIV